MLYRIVVSVAVLLVALASSSAEQFEHSRAGYVKWAGIHGRSSQPTGGQLRAWMENWVFVQKHNEEKSSTWIAELNKFADMTTAEFKEKILMKNAYIVDPNAKHKKSGHHVVNSDLPAHFDWRSIGGVTPVQDQGFVGTCWAFSTVANIEGQFFQKTNTTIKLSEEYFVDCDGTADPVNNHADCSIFGGWPYVAYQFAINTGGVPSEEAFPYCAGTGDCYPCMNGPVSMCGPPPYTCDRSRESLCKASVPVASPKSWRQVSTDETEMAADLVATGPFSVLLDAHNLQFYKGGVWDGSGFQGIGRCSATALDHAVLVTGFGTDGLDYWSLKNSWGADWGENGYFRIMRGTGQCGINSSATTAIL